jgi:hypothetical protein
MWQFYLFAVIIYLLAIIFHTSSTLTLELLNIHSVSRLLANLCNKPPAAREHPPLRCPAAGTPVKRTAPHLWALAHTPRPLWVHPLEPHFSSW